MIEKTPTDLNHAVQRCAEVIRNGNVLPGLGGAAEGSIGSSPDENFQPCVQQEDVATREACC